MEENVEDMSDEFIADCMHWRGRVLTGVFAHWCADYDELPVDEATPEWPCTCYAEPFLASCGVFDA